MRVTNLTQEYRELFFVCLEDWSDEIKEAGDHKQCWYNKMKDKGLEVKIAIDDDGKVGGMIQYIPIEEAFAEGNDLYMILCIWVHGHKKGRGSFQKKGMGKKLIEAAEIDVKNKGAKGIVAWGIPLPFWMKASWFRKQGYIKVDQNGLFEPVLLWKSFSDDAIPPKWIKQKKKPENVEGKVSITGFINGWCPAQNILFERARKVAEEFRDYVDFRVIDTSNRETFLEWGISDAVYLDGKKLRNGPPLPYKRVRKKIMKKVKQFEVQNNN